MKNFAELDAKVCSCTEALTAKLDGTNGKRAILLCGGTGCLSSNSMDIKGKYVIGCCLGTACYVKGAQQIIDKFSEILGVKPGETTADGLFTIDALRCIGACGIAPAVTINGKVYPKVTVDAVPAIVEEYRALGGVN